MDQKKTGRLIKRKRTQMGLSLERLAAQLYTTPSAVSYWEKGERYPSLSAQIMINKALGLNPVELLTGLEMYDEDAKKAIAQHMKRIDEEVFTGGIVTDENGIESYFDLSDFLIVTSNKDGEATDKWVPYLEYYNAEPHVMTEHERELKDAEDAIPYVEYDSSMAYVNRGAAFFIIPKEILEAIGKPAYFNICLGRGYSWIGLKFGGKGDYDIPDEVYEYKGLRVYGGEYVSRLCKGLGIREGQDALEVDPAFRADKNMLVLDLVDATRVKMMTPLYEFAHPTWQQ